MQLNGCVLPPSPLGIFSENPDCNGVAGMGWRKFLYLLELFGKFL
jgi:hypothetical protein